VATVSEDFKLAGIQFNTMDAATEKVLPMLSLVLGKKHCLRHIIVLNTQDTNQIGRLSYVMMVIILIRCKCMILTKIVHVIILLNTY